jgi:serine/threonine protein kinase
MSTSHGPAAQSLQETWQRLDRIVQNFEAAWRAGQRPAIETYLATCGADRQATLAELVHVELQWRLQAGEPARVESYMQRFPELADQPEAVVELIVSEYRHRHRREPGLSLEDYLRRFPQFSEELGMRLVDPASTPKAEAARGRRQAPRLAGASADRNLLFGVLALQMDFISRNALLAAIQAWAFDKAKPLGQILVEQGALLDSRRALLDGLVQEHVQAHGNDPAQSLAAAAPDTSIHEELMGITDPEVHASLVQARAAQWGEDPHATRACSVGNETSSGRRFQILRPHARGGLGVVFVAHDRELNREVALKEIQDLYADNRESRSRFLLEAEITGRLEHPGVVPVYGLGCYEDGRPYYAMRLIQGDSLKGAIDRFHQADTPNRAPGERALQFRQLLGRFIDVCNAVAYAHSRGVLHRDIKPGNVMLGKYGETLVVDWGLAKLIGRADPVTEFVELTLRPEAASASAPTLAGEAMGTPHFMSPEQAAGRLQDQGTASDVYGLGATLYYLLTGQAPFTDPDVASVLPQVQLGEFPAPRRVKRNVPKALEAICQRAMALRPADRYPSARAVADDIEHWLADEPVGAWREPLRLRLTRRVRRHKTLVIGVAALLVTAMAGLFLLDQEHQRTERAELLRQRVADHHLASLQQTLSEAEAEVRTDIAAGRFSEAQSAPLDQAIGHVEGEPGLAEQLAEKLDALRGLRGRVRHLARFYQNADEAWFRAGDDDGVGVRALASVEAALREVSILDRRGQVAGRDWWEHLPDRDLNAKERDRLQQEVYKQLMLMNLLRLRQAAMPMRGREGGFLNMLSKNPAAADAYRASLEGVEQIQAFEQARQVPPSRMVRLMKIGSELGLRLASGEPPPSRTEKIAIPSGAAGQVNAVDYFLIGMAHFFIGQFANEGFTRILDFMLGKELDTKTPLVTAEHMLRVAASFERRNFWAHFMLGWVLLAAKDYSGAELAFNTAASVREDDPRPYLLRGVALVGRATQLSTENAETRALRKQLIQRGRDDHKHARDLAPLMPDNYWFGGDLFVLLNEPAQALEAYARATELEDALLPRRLVRYTFLLRAHKYVDEMIRNDTPIPNASAVLALLLLRQDRLADARKAADQALKLLPGNARALAVRGTVSLREHKIESALADFDKAIRLDPSSYLAAAGRAQAHEQQADYAKALEFFDQLLRPNNNAAAPLAAADWQRLEAHLGCWRALTKLGRQKEASAALREARLIDPFAAADQAPASGK